MHVSTISAVVAFSDFAKYIAIPVVVAVLSSAGTLLVTRAGAAADRRRDRYAQAVSTLVAWVEFPYRVRRRTGDDPQTLGDLATIGHDLQEQLACHQAWIGTESQSVARTYRSARRYLDSLVGPAIKEAWESPPIARAADMNLGPWGPGRDASVPLAQLQSEIADRFGWRRIASRFRGLHKDASEPFPQVEPFVPVILELNNRRDHEPERN